MAVRRSDQEPPSQRLQEFAALLNFSASVSEGSTNSSHLKCLSQHLYLSFGSYLFSLEESIAVDPVHPLSSLARVACPNARVLMVHQHDKRTQTDLKRLERISNKEALARRTGRGCAG